MHKDVERILLSEEEMAQIVDRIAGQINKDYEGKEFMLIG